MAIGFLATTLAGCGGGGGGGASSSPQTDTLITLSLNDTGVTADQCYAAGSDVLVNCLTTSALQLNSSQDGMVGRDVSNNTNTDGRRGFSFSLINKADGSTYDKTECVKDNVTGLTWEGKTSSGTRSGNNNYTNYNDGRSGDASAYTSTVNQQTLCGFSDWRLPTIDELHSLVDYGIIPTSGAVKQFQIDADWLPTNVTSVNSTSVDNPGTIYWTGTQNPVYQNWWGRVDFMYSGEKVTAGGSANLYRVRLVRGAKAAAAQRYSYSTDGSEVTDAITGLIWRRCSEGQTWSGSSCTGAAATYTHELALARAQTQVGWRLPNVKELQTLADFTRRSPAIDIQTFPDMPSCSAPTYCAYWSSTPDLTGSSGVFTLVFNTGSSADLTASGFPSRSAANYHARLVKTR